MDTRQSKAKERPIIFSADLRWIRVAATRIGVTAEKYVHELNSGRKICGGCHRSLLRSYEYFGKESKTFDHMRSRCRECVSKSKRKHYHRTRDAQRARQIRYQRENRDRLYAYNREWNKKYRATIRTEMIFAYGGRCACCNEDTPQFLQLDHINNDGAEERRQENASGAAFFSRLKKRGWPKDRYQLLCANCNFGRHMNNGVCPHEKNRDA